METKTGSCHCQKVKYQVNIDLSQPVIECNCSHCQIKGMLLSFVPRAELAIIEGENELAEYRFNTNRIAHMFCKTCGVQPFGFGEDKDGNKTAAINVRTIAGIELERLNRMPYNGRDV